MTLIGSGNTASTSVLAWPFTFTLVVLVACCLNSGVIKHRLDDGSVTLFGLCLSVWSCVCESVGAYALTGALPLLRLYYSLNDNGVWVLGIQAFPLPFMDVIKSR